MEMQSRAFVRVGVVARKLGVHPLTVRRWARAGKIKAVQLGREMRVPASEIERLLYEPRESMIALYARVSRRTQKEDLTAQIQALQAWAEKERAGQPVEVFSDVGSGLNAERKDFQRLLTLVLERRISEVVVMHSECLTRFGLEYLQEFFTSCGTRLTILRAGEEWSKRELAEDLYTIVISFSGRLYGVGSSEQKGLLRCLRKATRDF